jgi:hypothetical protein
MFQQYEPEEAPIWLDALRMQLDRCVTEGILNHIFEYQYIAKALPNGPHSVYRDFPNLDWKKLQQWGAANSWETEPVPEEPPNHNHTPGIRFIRIHVQSINS